MRRVAVLACLFLVPPIVSPARTAPDLQARMIIDGRPDDFETDEWVLDSATDFPESSDDARWGTAGDIQGIAVTWDLDRLYLAVSGRFAGSGLVLLLDTDCGGPADLSNLDYLERNIHLSGFSANVLVEVRPAHPFASVLTIPCEGPMDILDETRFEAWFRTDGLEPGAFETTLPWTALGRYNSSGEGLQLPEAGATLRLIAVVTAGPGSGAADAAPDPLAAPPDDSTRTAILDNFLVLPLDSNRDGLLDLDVSPREIAYCSGRPSENRPLVPPVELRLAEKIFSPEQGEELTFIPELDRGAGTAAAYLTARVFNAAGELIRVIYEDERREFDPTRPPAGDSWDGRDAGGRLVPGGIYIVVLSAGPARGSVTRTVKASVAVIR